MALHSRVDYARDARLGPGVTFATHLAELLVSTAQHSTAQHPQLCRTVPLPPSLPLFDIFMLLSLSLSLSLSAIYIVMYVRTYYPRP
jgi:hypothetical protein